MRPCFALPLAGHQCRLVSLDVVFEFIKPLLFLLKSRFRLLILVDEEVLVLESLCVRVIRYPTLLFKLDDELL